MRDLKKQKEYRDEHRKKNLKHYSDYVKNYRRNHYEKSLLLDAKRRAKKFDVPFSITENDIVIPEFCPVFQIRLEKSEGRTKPNSPSLDRIIPSLGYIPGNVAVISHRANTIKNNGTTEEHRLIASFIERSQGKQ